MDLLDKFAQVEIRADARMTEADRAFCQKHQEAYQSALAFFRQLLALWQDTEQQQRYILSGPGHPDNAWSQYLTLRKFPDLDAVQIGVHLIELHRRFIRAVVSYFNTTYHLTIDADMVEDELAPAINEDGERDVSANLSTLVLRYENMVELILSRFGGRSFSEQAPYEMVMKCHRAAWKESDHTHKFVRKKSVITFLSDACGFGYSCAHGCDHWTFRYGIKDVLKGLAHFETGTFDEYPDDLGYLIPDDMVIRYDVWEFENCEKLERIKLFKNGRMDIRFTTEAYACQFVADYLGTVY